MEEIERMNVRLYFGNPASAGSFVSWAMNHGLRMVDMLGDETIEVIGLHSGDYDAVMRAAADRHVRHTESEYYLPAVPPLPSADIYANRLSLDEVYVDQHFRMVMGKPGFRPFKIRQTVDAVLAPWTALASMAELDTLCLAATGALPSELVN